MTLRLTLAILASCLTTALATAPAAAQQNRTWVSGSGDDDAACTRAAPCQTFAGALSKTAAGGEINCLDAGGFGAPTITKSITIDCSGIYSSIQAPVGLQGMIINGAGIVVRIRGLSITGGPPPLPPNPRGIAGIRIVRAASVILDDLEIDGFHEEGDGYGVIIAPSVGQIRVHIADSVISGNGSATSGAAIRVEPTASASVLLTISGVQMVQNYRGLDVVATGTTAGNTVYMTRSEIVGSANNGINVQTNANAVNLMVVHSGVINNLRGIVLAGAGASARVGDTVIMGNGPATSVVGGATILSYRNSQIDLNGNNTTPITQVPLN